MPFEKELQVALAAAEAAGKLIREQYEQFVAIPDAPADISTSTDRASQELILQRILKEFPRDALCAEEATPTLQAGPRSGPRLWVVDPIDGTRGFARKNGEFCVMIAFVQDGIMQVGVVHEPANGRVMHAARGQGCWCCSRPGAEPVRCRVGTARTLEAATMTMSRSRAAASGPVAKLLKPARVIETYSAGVKLAKVASGEADLYVNTYAVVHDWDVCAGHILVEEAGGRVTTLTGEPIRYGTPGNEQRGGTLASNGLIHAAAIERLKAIVETV